MKLKKIISLIVSLGIIISTLAGITTVSATEVTDAGFTNIAVNGSFDEDLGSTWTISASAEGSLTTVVDTKDPSNKVLRFDGTKNTKSISYINYGGGELNKTYYFSMKVRVAEDDTTTGNMYLYANSLSGVGKSYYGATRPQITKDGWAVCYGVATTSATSKNIGFKVISTQGTSGSNVPKAIYEIDDLVVYDLTGCELTLPADVSVVSGAFQVHDKKYAKVGDTVVLNYEGTDKVLSSETADIKKNGNTYTFTKPSTNTTVIIDNPPMPAFTNLIENGDMEGNVNNWKASSSVTGAVISLVKDTADASNHVIRYDGTGITAGSTSYIAYSNVLTEGKKYYFSYKIRMAEEDTNVAPLHAYNSNHVATTVLERPAISKDWTTRSGVFTARATSYNFKIVNSTTSSSGNSNVPKAIYELDDVVIYDMSDIYEIVLPENAEVTQGGKALEVTNADLNQVTTYYAQPGEEIKVVYLGEEKLISEDVTIAAANGAYTFTMPEKDVTVTLAEPPVPAFTNLVVNGDMEGTEVNWKAASSVTGAVISLVEDTADASNHVLRYDGTNITAGKISYMAYPDVMTEGRRYYYSYKIRMAQVDTNEGDLYAYNQNHSAKSDLARPKVTKEWTSRSGVVTAAKTSYNFKIVSDREDVDNTNVANAIYEIDDVVIYEMANIYQIYLPYKATVTSGARALPVTNSDLTATSKYYAEVGEEVVFTYTGDKGLKADTDMTSNGNVYTFTMPETEVVVSEIHDFSFDVVNNVPNVTVAKPQSFVIIAAKYSEIRELEDVYIAELEATSNGQVISLSDVSEFSGVTDWNGMNIFVWNNLTDMIALCDGFVYNQQ